MRFVNVAIPSTLHSAFTYALPDDMDAAEGMRVIVPFRKKRVVGIGLEIMDEAPRGVAGKEVRQIEGAMDESPVLGKNLMQLIRWMSAYYLAPVGEVLRSALPARLLEIDGAKTTRPSPPSEIEPMHEGAFDLTADQGRALEAILAATDGVTLLQGITGSGKTEVYLKLFEEIVSRGRQGLLLVPEIGLTPQLTGRAEARFGGRVAVYHSGLTDAQRHKQWLRMKGGGADVVIGTRSALFAPLSRLGAIVVDEEHDSSYKQDDGVMYNGRDAAVMRAHIEGIQALLGSATPSLESIANVERGKYRRMRLGSRPSGAALPSIEIVDVRRRPGRTKSEEKSEGLKMRREFESLSPELYDAISETLARGEQTLIFIGRRGFAGALQCDACGEVSRCPNCDISLSVHDGNILSCHYCGFSAAAPALCTACGASTLIPIGHGTQRLEAELSDFFPKARIARFDSDAAGAQAKRQGILSDMRRGAIDILVGTQMVTKGHDFPEVTLVGVVAADTSLNLPDFRSAERTFQLLTQVAGRAGRGTSPGRVIIQTRQPEHASLKAAETHDIDSFAEAELKHRKALSYPPFSRLANIRLSSLREGDAQKAAKAAASAVARFAGEAAGQRIIILGPAPAPIFKLRNRYRWQILIKSPTPDLLARLIASTRPAIAKALPRSVRLSIDVDPINLL
ncbi:MAG: primosomal protein N' [Pseudomonadota bacterium]